MSEDIASLGIKVDSTQTRAAADDLNKLNQAGKQTGEQFQAMRARSAELAGALAGIGIAGIVTGFIGMVRSTADTADRLRDLTKSTHLSVEALSNLRKITAQSGTDLEATAHSISRLSVNIANNREEYAKLGISAKDPLEAFAQLVDVLNSIEDVQERDAVAAQALGREWKSQAALIAEGGDKIREAGTAQSTITTQMADDSDRLNDSIVDLTSKFKGLITSGVGPAIPMFADLAQYLTPVMSELDGIKDVASEAHPVFEALAITVAAFAGIVKVTALNVGGMVDQIQALTRLDFNDLTAINIKLKSDTDAEFAKFEEFRKYIGATNIPDFKAPPKNAPSSSAISGFIGTGEKDGKGGSGGNKRTIEDTARSEIERLQKTIALYSDASQAAEVLYDTQEGALKNLDGTLKESLLSYAQQIDALKAGTEAEKKNEQAIKEKTQALEKAKREAEQMYQSQRKQADDIAEFLDEANRTDLQKLRKFYKDREKIILSNTAVTETERQQLLSELQLQGANAETGYYKSIGREQLRNAASTFGELAAMTRNNINQNNALYKAAFIASKAFAIAETTIATYEGAQKAFTALAGIPYVGPFLGAAAAGVAVVAGLARVANIASQNPGGGAFHGGSNFVPKEQSYLLDRGERVLSPRQNEDLTSYLRDRQSSGGNRSVVINMNMNVSGNQNSKDLRLSASQIAQRAGTAVNAALARNR